MTAITSTKPVLRLARTSDPLRPTRERYILHSLMFLENTAYRATGHGPILKEPRQEDGRFAVDLYVEKRGRFALGYPTPINHTINLGGLPLSPENPLLEVRVIEQESSLPFIGGGLIHRDEADEETN